MKIKWSLLKQRSSSKTKMKKYSFLFLKCISEDIRGDIFYLFQWYIYMLVKEKHTVT